MAVENCCMFSIWYTHDDWWYHDSPFHKNTSEIFSSYFKKNSKTWDDFKIFTLKLRGAVKMNCLSRRTEDLSKKAIRLAFFICLKKANRADWHWHFFSSCSVIQLFGFLLCTGNGGKWKWVYLLLLTFIKIQCDYKRITNRHRKVWHSPKSILLLLFLAFDLRVSCLVVPFRKIDFPFWMSEVQFAVISNQ